MLSARHHSSFAGGNKKLETEFESVLSAADDELLDKLDQAAEKGALVGYSI